MPSILGRAAALVTVALASTLVNGSVLAQGGPPFPLQRPPLPEPLPAQPPILETPPAPAPAPRRPSSGVAVELRAIRLVGNTVLSDAELTPITSRYVGRPVTTEDLLELRDAITRRYVERGYISSGAVIPDQDVADGVLTVEIVEGRLGEIAIEGLRALREDWLERRIRAGAGPPLNQNKLQERLEFLLTDPSIERLDARLGPGTERGEARLEVDVVEAPRFTMTLGADNHRSPSSGEYRASVEATMRNVLGYSDPLDIRLGLTEGLKDGSVAYSVPMVGSDVRLRLFAEATDADVVEAPFQDLDIESQTYTVEAGLRWPVIQSVGRELTVGADLVRRWSETRLLGEPFSFSPGVQDGKSDVTALRFPVEWLARSREQAVSLRSTVSVGLPLLGATENGGGLPDSRFLAWLGQAQWVRRFGEAPWQLILRGDVQLAADPLLPIEQIAIGGFGTVRGYRENQLVRDNGAILSVEGRIPTFRLPIPGLSQNPEDGVVQLAPFVDLGRGWNTGRDGRDGETIASIGAGLLWSPSPRLTARLYYGYALDDVPEPEDKGLQDHGIHLDVAFRLF